jgi:L-lactate dehydrogenase
MSFKDSKVVIVGAGNVGSTTAYSIISQGLCEEVVLIDVNHDKAYAEALDMEHSVFFLNRNINIHAGTYEDCMDADVVIVTASAPMPKDSHSRLEMLAPSMKIMKSIVTSVMKNGFNGIFLVISNPVDIMTYYVWKLSGLPVNQVIGSGTNLDSARLCDELAGLYDLDAKSVSAYVLGEHGDSEFVSWASATIGGKNVADVMRDNADRTKNLTRAELLKQTSEAGWDIFNRKGNTCYGIAASATAIVKSILFNENRIYPVSVCVNGQYGLDGEFLSVPTIIDKTGAREIVEIKLEKDEMDALHHSAELLKSFYRELEMQ